MNIPNYNDEYQISDEYIYQNFGSDIYLHNIKNTMFMLN